MLLLAAVIKTWAIRAIVFFFLLQNVAVKIIKATTDYKPDKTNKLKVACE